MGLPTFTFWLSHLCVDSFVLLFAEAAGIMTQLAFHPNFPTQNLGLALLFFPCANFALLSSTYVVSFTITSFPQAHSVGTLFTFLGVFIGYSAQRESVHAHEPYFTQTIAMFVFLVGLPWQLSTLTIGFHQIANTQPIPSWPTDPAPVPAYVLHDLFSVLLTRFFNQIVSFSLIASRSLEYQLS